MPLGDEPVEAATSRLPSAEDATHVQRLFGTLLVVHVFPPSLDVYRFPLLPALLAVMILVPSAEVATEIKSALANVFENQVEPEFVERKIVFPPQTAASRVPSAEDAKESQFMFGTLSVTQVVPKFAEE